MSEWPVGLSTGCFYRESILDCLTRIQRSGFNLIEICSAENHLNYHDQEMVREAAARIEELRLEPYSFHAPFAPDIDITDPRAEKRRYALSEILTAVEAAAKLNVGYFVIHPGPESSELPRKEHLDRLENAAGVLKQLSQRCSELGLGLVLENMLPHLFSGHVRDLLWILGSLETTDVGICLDTGHARLAGDLTTVVHKLSGHLWMVHASDNRGQRDDHLPPGEGTIDWRKLLRQLHRYGFQGPLILEISGEISPDQVVERARRSQYHLRALSRECRLADLAG